MAINLIVKGTERTATIAASVRGIPFVFSRYLPATRETVGETAEAFADKVVAWYHENPRAFDQSGAGFPDGTLLLYGNSRAQEPRS